jgi:hypothetical protein
MTNHMKRYSFPINPYDIMAALGTALEFLLRPLEKFLESKSIVAGWFKLIIVVLTALLLLVCLISIPILIYGEVNYGDDAKVFFTWPGILRWER